MAETSFVLRAEHQAQTYLETTRPGENPHGIIQGVARLYGNVVASFEVHTADETAFPGVQHDLSNLFLPVRAHSLPQEVPPHVDLVTYGDNSSTEPVEVDVVVIDAVAALYAAGRLENPVSSEVLRYLGMPISFTTDQGTLHRYDQD